MNNGNKLISAALFVVSCALFYQFGRNERIRSKVRKAEKDLEERTKQTEINKARQQCKPRGNPAAMLEGYCEGAFGSDDDGYF